MRVRRGSPPLPRHGRPGPPRRPPPPPARGLGRPGPMWEKMEAKTVVYDLDTSGGLMEVRGRGGKMAAAAGGGGRRA